MGKSEFGGVTAIVVVVLLAMQGGLIKTSLTSAADPVRPIIATEVKDEPGSKEPDPMVVGPWIATRQSFGVPNPWAAPTAAQWDALRMRAPQKEEGHRALMRELLGIPDGLRLYAVVATITDPAHTRLQLFYDEQLQALQRAAAVMGWQFDRFWQPPTFTPTSGSAGLTALAGAKRAELQQEAQPGMLIFRRARNEALFILLVPETPTSGIAQEAFHTAMNLARATEIPIGLLGPTYTGSFPSLTALSQRWRDALSPKIFSGSASSDSGAESLRAATGLKFGGGIASSRQYDAVLKQLLQDYRLSEDEVAFLTEDESAFSGAVRAEVEKAADNLIPTFTFPRDIANLRNAYRDAQQSAPGATKGAPAPSIDFTVKDSSRGDDGVPVIATTHTPITQSAALNAVMSQLNSRRTKLVILVSTNTLDTIFLTRLIRTEAPNTRVLVTDGDLLFLPAVAREALSGTLFLSTYPLSYEADRLLGGDGTVLFPTAGAQGLYNVTQLLLAGMGMDRPRLAGYRGFRQTKESDEDVSRPGLWLLSLTPGGFAPMNWWPADTIAAPAEDSPQRQQHSANTEREEWFQRLEEKTPVQYSFEPSQSWRAFAWVLAIGLPMGVLLLFFANRLSEATIEEKMGDWAWMLRVESAGQWLAMIGAAMSASALCLVVAWPAIGHAGRLGWWVLALALLCAIGALWATSKSRVVKTAETERGDTRTNVRLELYWIILWSTYLSVVFSWIAACGLPSDRSAATMLFRARAVDLASMASASLPLAALFLVYLLYAISLLLRYSANWLPHPRLTIPSSSNPEVSLWTEEMRRAYFITEAYLDAPVRLTARDQMIRLGFSLATFAALLFLSWGQLWPFEVGFASRLALGMATGLLSMLLAFTCFDLVMIWHGLHRFLRAFEALPTSRLVKQTTELWENSSVLSLGLTSPDPTARIQQRMLLQRLPAHRVIAEALSAYAAGCSGRRAFETVARSVAGASMHETGTGVAAQFCTLHICRYAVHAARQAQHIAMAVSFSFVMLVLALNSYPAQGPRVINEVLIGVFVILSGIVIWVLGGMEKNQTLSEITGSSAGDLSLSFWRRLAALGALPVMSLLASLFPEVSGFFRSWLAPNLEQMLR